MIQKLTTSPAPARAGLSSITSKAVMAVTGLGLVGFVILHMLGNLQMFLGQDAVNRYAKFLKDQGGLLWIARSGLLVIFVAHIYIGLRLKLQNVAARPTPYTFRNTIRATLASRTMALTGLVILAFVIYHLAHFTFAVTQQATIVDSKGFAQTVDYLQLKDNQGRHDVYAMTIYGFKNAGVSLAYIVAMIVLGFHLSHGIGSLFQTLGINHSRYTPLINFGGKVVAILIVVVNCSMPLAVLLGIVKL